MNYSHSLVAQLFALVALLGHSAVTQADPLKNEVKEAQIVHFERNGDGVNVVIVGPPGQLYGLMACNDGKNWEFSGIAAEMQPGVYVAFSDQVEASGRRLFVVVARDCQFLQYGQLTVQNLVEGTPGEGDLTSSQKGALSEAAVHLVNATNHLNQCRNELVEAERNESDCLKLVAAARLAMEQAQAEAAAAAEAAKKAASAVSGIQSDIVTVTADLATAEGRRDQWEHEMNVHLDWVADASAAGDEYHAVQYRANAANAQANYEAWAAEADRIAENVAAAQADLAAAEAAAIEATAAAAVTKTAAESAEKAYEDAKKKCEPTHLAAQQKRDEVVAAERGQKEAADSFREAQDTAGDQAQENRDKAEDEAEDSNDDGTSSSGGESSEKEVSPTALKRMREIAKFLEFLKAQGEDALYEDTIRSIFGSLLDAGTTTLDAIGSMLEQLAAGGSGSGGAALTGVAGGLVQFGYGLVVNWVQGAAEAAAKGLATRTISALAILEVPRPGDVKYVPVDEDTAYLFIRNADGTVTTFVYSGSSKLTSGRYKLP